MSKYSKSKLLFSPVIVSLLFTLFGLSHRATVTEAQAQKPLLGTQVNNVTATSNTTVNATLPEASILSGKVTSSDTPPPPFLSGTVVAQSGDQSFSGSFTGFSIGGFTQPATYSMVLPNGTYKLSIQRTLTDIESPESGASMITTELPGTITVAGNTTRDLTLPTSPTLINISGKVTSQGTLPTEGALSFVSDDKKAQANVNFDGTYSAKVPSGTYDVVALVVIDATEQGLALRLGKITVNGAQSFDFMLPATVTLSGTVKYGNGAAAIPSSVVAIDMEDLVDLPTTSTQPCAGGFFTFPLITSGSVSIPKESTTGAYRLALPPRTYSVGVSLDLDPREEVISSLFFPSPLLQLALSADRTQDFTVPTLPDFVIVSGTVTDSMGQPVAGANVSAPTSMITNTPNATFSTNTTTGNDGKYEMRVLSGTGYTITFCPPRPNSGVPTAKSVIATGCTSSVAALHR